MYSRFLRMSARVRAMSAVRLSSSNCEATEKTCAIVDCCHSRRGRRRHERTLSHHAARSSHGRGCSERRSALSDAFSKSACESTKRSAAAALRACAAAAGAKDSDASSSVGTPPRSQRSARVAFDPGRSAPPAVAWRRARRLSASASESAT